MDRIITCRMKGGDHDRSSTWNKRRFILQGIKVVLLVNFVWIATIHQVGTKGLHDVTWEDQFVIPHQDVRNVTIGSNASTFNSFPQREFDEALSIERVSSDDENATFSVSVPSSSRESAFAASSSLNVSIEDWKSVDYVACCGLGHRLVRMACAYHIARQVGADLRTFWGWCTDSKTKKSKEVFSSLFDPDDDIFKRVQSFPAHENLHFRYSFANEVPGGYSDAVRRNLKNKNGTDLCSCHESKIAADFEFYSGLVRRYRFRDQVDMFVSKYFSNFTVYGLHVRVGNGEQGDFINKQRGLLQGPTEYVEFVSNSILTHYEAQVSSNMVQLKPPLLYIATDTPAYIALFRKKFNGTVPVMDLPQERARSGVFFGQSVQGGFTTSDQCLQRWRDAVTDMILLSRADVVIAGRPSSFTQTMPMSIAFGKSSSQAYDRPFEDVYCEVEGHQRAENFTCYSSYHQWCCETDGWLRQEFVRFRTSRDNSMKLPRREARPKNRSSCRPTTKSPKLPRSFCLAHDWKIDGF